MELSQTSFNVKLQGLIDKKGANNRFLTEEFYKNIIDKIRIAKGKERGKITSEYKLLKRYDVVKISETEKLIKPVSSDSNNIVYCQERSDF
ncbi:hypothetical protein QE152_g33043 [Popillia japonica]|uniref:Uncharacterized protein n=1 Tax=Popillia japonica TaxID=7064 RepID=A0AAW1IYI0_POPJA